jgi:hypothetical protein
MSLDYQSDLSSEQELLELVKNPSKIASNEPWSEIDDFMLDLGLVSDEYNCPKFDLLYLFLKWKKINLASDIIKYYTEFDELIGDRLVRVKNNIGTVLYYRCNKEVAWANLKRRQEVLKLKEVIKKELQRNPFLKKQKSRKKQEETRLGFLA